jgi:hypothetical protein
MSDTNIDTTQERKPLSMKIYCMMQIEKISHEYEFQANSWQEAFEKMDECPEPVDGSHCYEGSYAPSKLGFYVMRTCAFDTGAWRHVDNPCFGTGSFERHHDDDTNRWFYRHAVLDPDHGYICSYCEREMRNNKVIE